MQLKSKLTAAILAAAISVTTYSPAQADGLAGAYLAGRIAGTDYDFKAASQYYARALARDTKNPFLMEFAILSFVGAGEIERAIPVAKRLHSTDPDNQIANMLVMADLAKSGDFDGAFNFLESGSAVGPLVDGLVMAWVQIGQGQMSGGIATFDEVSKSPGLASFGMYHKAMALAIAGDLEGADEILSGRAGQQLPPTRRGVMAHIEILSQLERNQDAVDRLTELFGNDLDPGLASLKQRLLAGETLPMTVVRNATDGIAEVYFTVAGALLGETNDSYTLLYTRIAELLRPDHTEAILLSAQLLENLARYELATEAYNKIPLDDPAFHVAELGRAEALRKSGNIDAAIEVLQRLSKSNADQASIHVALGDLLRRNEMFEDATAAYDKAIALNANPDASQWPLYFSRGITYERTDRWEQAEADFRKALELVPDQPQVLNYLGYSFVEMKQNLDEALDMIQRAVAGRPNDGYITDSLGWVLYRLGRYQEAVPHMERAAELEPVDPIINDHLGDVFWAVGRKREAEFQWYRALSFEPEEEDAVRIRRKLEIGLDAVLEEEGAKPIKLSNDG